MSLIVYIYSKCSTCQDALRFLNENKIDYQAKEITVTPPSIQELQQMLDFMQGNIKKLFNTSGQLYRSMQLSEQLTNLTTLEALTLLNQQGMLVKRPFVISQQMGLVGFKETEWIKILK